MRQQRLNTEELIQQHREQYNASKYAEQIKEMELTILLKDKQMKCLTLQISSLKEESNLKISLLERQVIDLQKELGQNRGSIVRQRRLQSQKYQKLLTNMRKDYELKLEQIQEQNNLRLQALNKQHRQQIHRTQKKYQQLMELQKQELLALMNINQDQKENISIQIRRLEEQRAHLTKLKREAEHKSQHYREVIQQLKAEFQLSIQQKDEELNAKIGEIQGLKLEKKLMNEQLEILKEKQFNSHSSSRQTNYQLNQHIVRLTDQNTQLKRQIENKNQQLLKYHWSINQQQRPKVQINPVYQCTHMSLINQMTKNLQLKDKEIINLKTIIEQWSSLIGFDKPLTLRLSQITQKSQNVKSLNSILSGKLKQQVQKTKIHKQ